MTFGFALLAGFAMVFVIEGLVLALLPKRIEDVLRVIAQIPNETRRVIGLSSVALGVVLIWVLLGIA